MTQPRNDVPLARLGGRHRERARRLREHRELALPVLLPLLPLVTDLLDQPDQHRNEPSPGAWEPAFSIAACPKYSIPLEQWL